MSALTVRMLAGLIRYEIGKKPGTPIELRELVNQAGEHLVAMFPWRWLEGRSITLRQRAAITLDGATWTEATKTLTKTGAFANYTVVSGDGISILAGTGATLGTFEVASKTSSDAIVLSTSIGAAANGQTDIDAEMPNDQVALTAGFDIQSVTAIQTSNGLVTEFAWTMAQGLLDLRTWPGHRSTASFRGLLAWARAASGGAPVLRLEVWPPGTDDVEFLTLRYRAGWLEPAEDTSELSIPGWLNLLFIEVLKAVVNGYEDKEGGSVDRRLTALKGGSLFADAALRDAMLQPGLGPMEGGWMDNMHTLDRFDVETPLVLPAS